MIAAGCALAAAAFTMGAALGDGGTEPTLVAAPGPERGLPPGQLAGQRIVIGFEGPTPPPSVRRMIRSGHAAGVVLFADNYAGRAGGRRMIRSLQSIARPPGPRYPLLVLTDQEGGLVKRIDGAPAGSAREMAARGPAYSRRQGRRAAANLRDVGVNVNLAPVLDVARPGSALTETAREWGHTPGRVAAGAIPFAVATQAAGVASAAKHFPGLGAVRGNTDIEMQQIRLSRRALRRIDETPFRRFVDAGGMMVMLSAAVYPAFSPKPAVFARPIVTGELRRRLGFRGVILTDALDTVSALEIGSPTAAGIAAARAGADLLLFTDHAAAESTRRALVRRLRDGSIDRAAFKGSVIRILRLRSRLAR